MKRIAKILYAIWIQYFKYLYKYNVLTRFISISYLQTYILYINTILNIWLFIDRFYFRVMDNIQIQSLLIY